MNDFSQEPLEKSGQVVGDVLKTVDPGYFTKKIASLYYFAIYETCRTVLHNTCQSKKSFQIKKLKNDFLAFFFFAKIRLMLVTNLRKS